MNLIIKQSLSPKALEDKMQKDLTRNYADSRRPKRRSEFFHRTLYPDKWGVSSHLENTSYTDEHYNIIGDGIRDAYNELNADVGDGNKRNKIQKALINAGMLKKDECKGSIFNFLTPGQIKERVDCLRKALIKLLEMDWPSLYQNLQKKVGKGRSKSKSRKRKSSKRTKRKSSKRTKRKSSKRTKRKSRP